MLYSELLAEWWSEYEPGIMDSTAEKKAMEMRVHILPKLGAMPVEALTPEILRNFAASFKLTHKPASVVRLLKIIRPSLEYAVEQGIIAVNPMLKVRCPRIYRIEIDVFSTDEARALIFAATIPWFADTVILAYRTGMRRGEVMGLKWIDVHLDDDIPHLFVNRIAVCVKGKRRIHPVKTRSSRRRIDLDAATCAMLCRRRASAVSEWVFVDSKGNPPNPTFMSRYVGQTCKKAGIRRRRFHDLRHTHATMLLAAGINPKVVQERLGHSNVKFTLEVYGHVLPSMQRDAIRVLDTIA